jgi:hypothetical protein
VLVLDRLGTSEGALVAEALIASGRQVTFVTPLDTFAPLAGYSHRKDFGIVFRKSGTRVLTDHELDTFDGSTAKLSDPEGRTSEEIGIDTVVAVTAPVPQVALAATLDLIGLSYRIIGDAVAPRGVQVAMREADDAARDL